MIKKNILKLWNNNLFRFFAVSGLNTLVGYGLFALLICIGLPYPVALLVATILAILFNFKTYGSLVFKNKNNQLVFKFFLVYSIVYLFNYFGLRLFSAHGISEYVGYAILAIPAGLLGFALNKRFVFNKKPMADSEAK